MKNLTNIRRNIMGTTSFDFLMKGMRKPQDFITYPLSANNEAKEIVIQSDKRIGRLSLETGKGRMSQNHANGAYNHNLAMDKLIDFEISAEELSELRGAILKSAGSLVGNSIVKTDNSGAYNVAV